MLKWLTQINSLLIWQLWLRCMCVRACKRMCMCSVCRLGVRGGYNGTLLPLVKVTLGVYVCVLRCRCKYIYVSVWHTCWTRYHHISCDWVLSWRKAVCWDVGIAWTASTTLTPTNPPPPPRISLLSNQQYLFSHPTAPLRELIGLFN